MRHFQAKLPWALGLIGIVWVGSILLLWALDRPQEATFLLKGGFAAAGVALAGGLLQRWGEKMLRRRLLVPAAPPTAERLYRLGRRWLGILLFLGGSWAVLSLWEATDFVALLWRKPWGYLLGVEWSLGHVASSILAMVFAFSLSAWVRTLLEHLLFPRLPWDEGTTYALDRLIHVGLLLLGGLLALRLLGVSGQSLGLVAGGLSVGLGFGLQHLASNLISGLLLLLGREVRRGDHISLGSLSGVVEEIGIRATTLRTAENLLIVVPNARFLSESIVNRTAGDPTMRLEIPISVPGQADPQEVKGVLETVARSQSWALPQPPPQALLKTLGPTTLEFLLLVWIHLREVEALQAQSELNYALWAAFKEKGWR